MPLLDPAAGGKSNTTDHIRVTLRHITGRSIWATQMTSSNILLTRNSVWSPAAPTFNHDLLPEHPGNFVVFPRANGQAQYRRLKTRRPLAPFPSTTDSFST